jgi:hypothetical protein
LTVLWVCIEDSMLMRKVIYHFSHTPRPLCSGYFEEWVSLQPQSSRSQLPTCRMTSMATAPSHWLRWVFLKFFSWPPTVILHISGSQGATITGVNQWHQTPVSKFERMQREWSLISQLKTLACPLQKTSDHSELC